MGPGVQRGQTEISDDDIGCHQWTKNQISETEFRWGKSAASAATSTTWVSADRTFSTSEYSVWLEKTFVCTPYMHVVDLLLGMTVCPSYGSWAAAGYRLGSIEARSR